MARLKRACVFKGVHLKRASTTIRLLPNLCVMLPHVACLPTPRVIAARFASVDFVAAYLQGDFIEGEIIYCFQPPGSNVIGTDGRPMVCAIKKPIYGIPQAGRRLQRKIFPWCKEVIGLRQLDDSDDAVFVWDDPAGKEIFAIGVYVDNLQIVHSAEIDDNGDAVDAGGE